MIEYTGPVPPLPGEPFDAAKWGVWQTHQVLLQNIRFENERADARSLAATQRAEDIARRFVLDAQHADEMAAKARCAEAMNALPAAAEKMMEPILAAWTARDQAIDRQTAAMNAIADAMRPPMAPPSDLPPEQVDTLLSDAFAVLRRLQAAYAPRTSP